MSCRKNKTNCCVGSTTYLTPPKKRLKIFCFEFLKKNLEFRKNKCGKFCQSLSTTAPLVATHNHYDQIGQFIGLGQVFNAFGNN